MYDDGEYKIIADDILKRLYLNRFDDNLKKYYLKEYTGIRKPVYQLNKPVLYDDKINLCHPLPTPKSYNEFSEETKEKVNIFLSYIKETLASNNEEVYNYLLKWIAYMCKGNKNDCALVFRTHAEGVGKSTLPIFIRKHVLKEKLCLETGSEPIRSHFNGILGGKLFVSFEELESFSANDWMHTNSILKRFVTSQTYLLQNKGQDSYEAENINNYFILSNNDVGDAGRRYFVADISTHRLGDRNYWTNLYKDCFNDEVGYAFFVMYMR
jgi:hypothetical protein